MTRRDFLLALSAAWLFTGCGKKQKHSPLPTGAKVLAFGDSVTFGTGAALGEDWPALLSGMTGWQVVNAGIPGDTAQAARTRIQGALDEHQPTLVIIEIGGNDFLRRRGSVHVKEDIRHLIRTSLGAGAKVVLIGVPELSLLAVVAGKPGDASIYAELAKEEGVVLIPEVFSKVLAQPELCADRIHPNAQGYRQMAHDIFASLREIGLAN